MREQSLVSHFEYFCNEKKYCFFSVWIVTVSGCYSDTIMIGYRHYLKAIASLSKQFVILSIGNNPQYLSICKKSPFLYQLSA